MLIRALATALFLTSGAVAAHDAHQHPAPAGSLQVDQAWARALPPNAPAAAVYLRVNNPGAADRLLSVSTAMATRAELHATRKDGELLKMQREDSVEVPAGGQVTFAPGGRHVMLLGLQQPLVAGAHFKLNLIFEKAGQRQVEVEVRDQAPTHGQPGHDHAHDH